jgi:hypothetical protein
MQKSKKSKKKMQKVKAFRKKRIAFSVPLPGNQNFLFDYDPKTRHFATFAVKVEKKVFQRNSFSIIFLFEY